MKDSAPIHSCRSPRRHTDKYYGGQSRKGDLDTMVRLHSTRQITMQTADYPRPADPAPGQRPTRGASTKREPLGIFCLRWPREVGPAQASIGRWTHATMQPMTPEHAAPKAPEAQQRRKRQCRWQLRKRSASQSQTRHQTEPEHGCSHPPQA